MSTDETTPDDVTPVESTEDFDAFWQSRTRKRKVTTIMGRRTELPAALPLQFELEAKKVARSKRDKDVRRMVSILFGDEALAEWAEAGMDSEQFAVLLAWAPRVIAGHDVTLAQVAQELADYQAAQDKRQKDGTPDPR